MNKELPVAALSMSYSPTAPESFFQLVCPKNGCARPLGNSDIWNFFDGIYYVIWHLVIFKGGPVKKHPVQDFYAFAICDTFISIGPWFKTWLWHANPWLQIWWTYIWKMFSYGNVPYGSRPDPFILDVLQKYRTKNVATSGALDLELYFFICPT